MSKAVQQVAAHVTHSSGGRLNRSQLGGIWRPPTADQESIHVSSVLLVFKAVVPVH